MVTKPTVGQPDWGDDLNTALDELQADADAAQATADTAASGVSSLSSSVTTLQGDVTTLQAADTALDARLDALESAGAFQPPDHGLVAWTADPGAIGGAGFTLVAGQVYLTRLKVMNAVTANNVIYQVTTAGTSLTAGQCFVGLYNSSGTLLASSADQAAAMASTGTKTAAITPQSLVAGSYYIAFLANGAATQPSVAGGAGNSALTNVSLTAASARALNTSAGNTSLPASITLASQTTNNATRWGALS